MSVGQPELFGADPADAPDNRLREPLAAAFARVPSAWRSLTDSFLHDVEGRSLTNYVDQRVRDGAVVYPRQVFRALDFVPPDEVRVVILGQDPYHGPGQAKGLAFSVAPDQTRIPPSLRNILKEIASDTGASAICRDDLTPWAKQGVLLLNAVLTVEDGAPNSHANRGWEVLTDALLARVAAQPTPAVFMLWGAAAQGKRGLIERPGLAAHMVLQANHPSPLSAMRPPVPFIGCRHFSRSAAFLNERRPGSPGICW